MALDRCVCHVIRLFAFSCFVTVPFTYFSKKSRNYSCRALVLVEEQVLLPLFVLSTIRLFYFYFYFPK